MKPSAVLLILGIALGLVSSGCSSSASLAPSLTPTAGASVQPTPAPAASPTRTAEVDRPAASPTPRRADVAPEVILSSGRRFWIASVSTEPPPQVFQPQPVARPSGKWLYIVLLN